MSIGLRLIAAACLVVLFTLAAQAAESLTGGRIKAFMSSFTELKAFAETRQIDFKRKRPPQAGAGPFQPFTGSLGELRAAGAYGEASRIVRRHGFPGMESWAAIGDRILRAYIALNMQGQQPRMAAGMDQARAMIMNNPNMTEEQKAQALASIGASMGSMRRMQDADPADKAAIGPYRAQLDAAFGNENANRRGPGRRDDLQERRSFMPPPRPAVPPAGSQGVKARLGKLKELYDAGLMSRQEYDAKRSAILSEL